MTVLIGTDEAGYGPNLGPLVITATAWRLPASSEPEDIRDLLRAGITSAGSTAGDRLKVADSKQIFASGGSLAPLERTVLAVLRVLGKVPETLEDLGTDLVGPDFVPAFRQDPCCRQPQLRLPCEADEADLVAAADRLTRTLQESGVQLLSIRSCVLFPAEFNRRVTDEGSKGRVLSLATLRLAADVLRETGAVSATIICDKHGGRNRYDELLRETFDEEFVFRMEEGRRLSRYRAGRKEFRFQAKAEQHVPVALASMVSKYVREIAMAEFNAFWARQLPGLKPTKGYPEDAVRFMNDIESARRTLELDRSRIWRSR